MLFVCCYDFNLNINWKRNEKKRVIKMLDFEEESCDFVDIVNDDEDEEE